MDLSHIWRLRHFIAIVENGSFQAAARAINISQPALTKSIRLLEDEFATALFLRRPRGVIPTEEGYKLEIRARAIVEQWSQALTEIGAQAHGEGGEFHIGAGPVYSAVFFPQLLADLRRIFPRLKLTVTTGSASDLLPELNRGRIRAYAGGIPGQYDESSLGQRFITHKFGLQKNSLYAAANHPIHALDVTPTRLLEYPWLGLFNARIGRDKIATFFDEADLPPPTFALESHSIHIAVKMLLEHQFIACLPQPLTRIFPADQIKRIDVPGFDWSISTGLSFNETSQTYPPLLATYRILKSLADLAEGQP